MGGFASIHRGCNCTKDAQQPLPPQPEPAANAAKHTKMDEATTAAESNGGVDEAQLESLRVKDPDAWKGDSPRPRSALKNQPQHPQQQQPKQIAEGREVTGSAGGARPSMEASPSRRYNRKVSFQLNGLGPVPGLELGGEEGGPQHANKRVRASDEFSMPYLVDKFYSKVLSVEQMRPFFEGVDMTKLKNQQEALMLLVFGGQELLEDELPGLAADLRLIHLHLLFEGLNLTHWQLFADKFSETLDELPQIPEDVKQRAKGYMASTKNYFRPIEPHEWPPKVVYKGWTKRSCPFHSPAANASASAGGEQAAEPGKQQDSSSNNDHSDFILPGFKVHTEDVNGSGNGANDTSSPPLESLGTTVGIATGEGNSCSSLPDMLVGERLGSVSPPEGWSALDQAPPPEEEEEEADVEVTPVEAMA
ncbi:hypothetical protein Agub_g15297 [Astrephomene gubernaculifera]|uniref:Uncharacterized protein n=1 Tax=Astrephomene gubernaculifera TaxID=47775 RepID=A0AAD3E534_9CHLO|nr:hypothetical protein Agub_g15297 [Astrephomene gubernaculifera]